MTTHTFKPDHWYNTIGSHPPVLRVADGDTVITTTVDAWGLDENNAQATPSGNPMTGPFYIEGAEPGDTLAVTIDTLWPNRDLGYIYAAVAENTVDPGYIAELPRLEDRVGVWRVDRTAGTARLEKPLGNLGSFEVKLDPMIGCFGVAPSLGQAISTATSGEWGGNMDYRGFGAGVTVYFPVSALGALFHIGDVHALQGHGEILGTGIEISADVQFTVRVIKGKKIGWPRGENAGYIWAAGNARPLDQAAQHAVTEMLRWLMSDYGLDSVAAGILLGHLIEYEVGNFFDPAYTMICKLPKAALTAYFKS